MATDFTQSPISILGFAAYSGTGKTTLLAKVIPLLVEAGVRVALVKHAHHRFDVDQPGKDSYRLRKAGAEQVLVASKKRWALMVETPQSEQDPDLFELIRHLDNDKLDLILVEGFKHAPIPKIELIRKDLNHPRLYQNDPQVIAIATDQKLNAHGLTQLDINDAQTISEFITNYLWKKQHD
jgi:molybdopterin-guanine dinucleotide biosynthesis protein MobB